MTIYAPADPAESSTSSSNMTTDREQFETVRVDPRIMSMLKFHLIRNVLPELTDIEKGENQEEFRNAVLELWVGEAIQEKMRRDSPKSKATEQT